MGTREMSLCEIEEFIKMKMKEIQNAEKDQLQNEIHSMKQEMKTMKECQEAQKADNEQLKEQIEMLIRNHQEEIDMLVRNHQAEMEGIINEHREEIETYVKEIKDLKDEVKSLKDAFETVQIKNQDLVNWIKRHSELALADFGVAGLFVILMLLAGSSAAGIAAGVGAVGLGFDGMRRLYMMMECGNNKKIE